MLNDEGARGFDDGGDGRGCFGLDVPSTLIFLEEALFDFLILGIFFCAGSIFIHALSRFLLGALTFLVARLGLLFGQELVYYYARSTSATRECW